jgi:hypothetical protein
MVADTIAARTTRTSSKSTRRAWRTVRRRRGPGPIALDRGEFVCIIINGNHAAVR